MRTKTLKQLERQLDTLKTSQAKRRGALESQIQARYNKQFERSKELKADLAALAQSTQFAGDDGDLIYTWTSIKHFDLSALNDHAVEALKKYLAESGCSLDAASATLNNCQGTADDHMIINEDGDVFTGGKCIIEHTQYTTRAERHTLIRQHMGKPDYFPVVLFQSRYGELTLVNFMKESEE